MDSQNFDVVVIGTGPGGEGAAMQATKLGKSVAVVERFRRIGGSCTHRGTIPSKALRFAIYQVTSVLGNKLFRDVGLTRTPTFPDLRRTAASVIEKQVDMRLSFYERNGVPLFVGHARFRDPNTLEVFDEYGGRRELRADSFIVATGSRPYRPAEIDFSHPRVFDSDTILDLAETPRTITIYGAGVIGCEYASMFRNLGVKVNLVNTRQKLLEFLDDEIIDALSYHLRDRGVIIRHNEAYERVEPTDDGVVLHLKSGKQIKTDVLFWAAGRNGNTVDMGLEEIGLVPNRRGQLEVNEDFQTTLPHIYAVGDVIGVPSLASAAYVQGRYAAMHLANGVCERALISEIPTGIYTSPEISSLGKTERELTEAGVPYEVGQSMFKSLARAQITGRTVGMLKLLFHRETLQLLGIHCFGANASEIIHIGQAVMSQPGEQNSLRYFVNSTFNYPTMAEAYRVAALNGLNRLF
ncbi:Soluble pyridine nucleotide transhydrogenase [Maioricimonas rarisocia]|uniref:Soluble pyridine nucleotide transhydrogenase n=1 Tax=Maioricimonas rarisocia TaxID=2528026 RepID=A0A517YZS7_9PLAN|nr:Si-specific NAD(P)(+) transhydrogenase [Maioricimonas rarisocia]QDU35725.1 Soluble pyridine nucleotide transhydrogenase [Maioricimonas rarisocia]